MERVALLPDAQRAKLPDPTVLWWRAQLVRRWNSERKAQAPLDVIGSDSDCGGPCRSRTAAGVDATVSPARIFVHRPGT